jgi:GTP-binding protein
MADIPGIIEGASEGKGLGLRFLRHIERNSILLFLIPADADSLKAEYEILLNELIKYNPELADKRKILAISKSDMLDQNLMTAMTEDLPEDVPYLFISSVTQYNLQPLKDLLWEELNKETFHDVTNIVYKSLDIQSLQFDDDDFDIDNERENDIDLC